MENKKLKDLKIGDKVVCDGDSGFCDRSIEKIKDITIQYDKNTGEKYTIIHLDGDQQFDTRNGDCIKGAMAYYIEPFIEK